MRFMKRRRGTESRGHSRGEVERRMKMSVVRSATYRSGAVSDG